jgi:hypothetical protein
MITDDSWTFECPNGGTTPTFSWMDWVKPRKAFVRIIYVQVWDSNPITSKHVSTTLLLHQACRLYFLASYITIGLSNFQPHAVPFLPKIVLLLILLLLLLFIQSKVKWIYFCLSFRVYTEVTVWRVFYKKTVIYFRVNWSSRKWQLIIKNQLNTASFPVIFQLHQISKWLCILTLVI